MLVAKIEGVQQTISRLKREEAKALRASNTSVVTGYRGVKYAIYVHENLNARHTSPTKAKYLEDPARILANSGELNRTIVNAVRAGSSLLKAVVFAAQKIQAMSQLQVPVDIGNLQGSAFTEVEKG